MKLATWNVNGIRARHAQVLDWIEQERPDVVCLQEIKATPDQIPESLFGFENYWSYWHGGKGYSGVALHVSKSFSPERPAFSHPDFARATAFAIAENLEVHVQPGGLQITRTSEIAALLEDVVGSAALLFAGGIACGCAHAQFHS